jgi:hypothetical protein
METEGICKDCKKVGDCKYWLRMIKYDDVKRFDAGTPARTITTVIACEDFERK